MEALMKEYASDSSSDEDNDNNHSVKESNQEVNKAADFSLTESLETDGKSAETKAYLPTFDGDEGKVYLSEKARSFGDGADLQKVGSSKEEKEPSEMSLVLSNVDSYEEEPVSGAELGLLVKKEKTATNYFGLSAVDSDEEISEVVDRCKSDDNKVESVNVRGKLVSVEIPGSSFWDDVKSSELQSFQDSVIERERRDRSNVNQRKRIFPGSEQSNSYSSKYGKVSVQPKQYSSSKETQEIKSHSFKEAGSNRHLLQDRKLYFVHPKIAPLLHYRRQAFRVPSKPEWQDQGHSGAVNRIKWNVESYSHLFVTCSMDSTIKIWNIWSQLDPCLKILSNHTKAVRDVEWNQDGKKLLSCSYDKTATVTDVEKGCPVFTFQHTCFVSCGKWQPTNPSLCVTGGQNQLQAWDCRSPDVPVRNFEYKDNFGQIQDILFLEDGSTFFSSSDLVSRDSADRNLMAWDFSTGVTLSNQIYQERYTISRLRLHPQDGNFLAQSNGNYIAIFSTTRPYKMNRQKRFEGHKLLGYSLGLDVTPDGSTVVSGSSDGKIYCYNYQTGKLFRTIQTDMDVIMDLSFHPILPSTMACCAWDGSVQVWK